MTYRLSRAAEEDLIGIYLNGIHEFGVDQAEHYHVGLERIFAFLSENPRAARERAEISPPVRVHRYKAHLVVYRLHGSHILILRVRHGREDWMNHE